MAGEAKNKLSKNNGGKSRFGREAPHSVQIVGVIKKLKV